MFLLTPVVFAIAIIVFAFVWNRFFDPVPRRLIAAFAAIVTIYQAETFFTSRVDVPGDLAYHAYPWKALGYEGARANSGIVMTQMIPWTETARDQIREGELPLWNRYIGAGSPLLANLQTSILHPFNLIGVPLDIGEAWTLSAALRLFFSLFFMFVFLRAWQLHTAASVFGSVAYTFSTFHVISLLFPLGLTMMTLPMTLAASHLFLADARRRTFLLLTIALALAILGGHPESSLWVGLTTGAYALYAAWTAEARRRALARLAISALAAIAACALTAPYWYPTTAILPHTERFAGLSSKGNPVDHGVGADWMLPLLTPNILGTPQFGSYRPPQPRHVSLPDDYGEVAATYAGIAAVALTLVAAFTTRRRPFAFFAAAMVISFLTVYETPLWYDVVRSVPWLGIGLHQRWRFLWALGLAVNGSIALDAWLNDRLRASSIVRGVAATAGLLGFIYFFRLKEFVARGVVVEQLGWAAISFAVLGGMWFFARRSQRELALFAIAATFIELVLVMFRYNPPTTPARLFPSTGAIARMQNDRAPYRMAALGWSFIPDTPGYYRLEDVKTTDVVQYQHYLHLYRYFLKIDPGDFNQQIRDVTSPFLDFLNVRYLYVPPDATFNDPSFERVYGGRDGSVYRNREALPRYFFVARSVIEPRAELAAGRLAAISDFGSEAVVDHVPSKIARMMGGVSSPGAAGTVMNHAGGSLRVAEYRGGETELAIDSRGWNLLVSSDVNMPGWRAYWNGERLPPVVVNGAFIGCFIPPGRGTLRFRYMPEEFEDGLRATAGALIVLAVALTAARKRRAVELK